MKHLILISMLISFLPASVSAVTLPPDFKASYSLEKYGNIVAEMQLSLETAEGRAIYRSQSKTRGLAALLSREKIDETSQLDVSEPSSLPQLMTYRLRHQKRKKRDQQFAVTTSQASVFRVLGIYGDQPFELEHTTRVWDRLSVQLALICLANNSTEIPPKARFQVINKGRLNEYLFEYEGESVVKIKDRSYPALKFKRTHGKRSTTLWLAKELHFLPVQIEQYKNGELNLRMSLERIDL
jgi:hypothetical protein